MPEPSQRRNSNRFRPTIEALEDRAMLDANAISGFVYFDANNNGIFDDGEEPIADSQLELRDSAGRLIATASTDENGFYIFDRDDRIDTTPRTVTRTIRFNEVRTSKSQTLTVPRFDDRLGMLVGVTFEVDGLITSDIKVENLDDESTEIVATVSGSLFFFGPGWEGAVEAAPVENFFRADAYDGRADYQGRSGMSFGKRAADAFGSIELTEDEFDLSEFIGTGNTEINFRPMATSNATGGGNLQALITSTGSARVTVTYTYVPRNDLKPGNYRVIQMSDPEGTFDGKLSLGGVVIPGSVGKNSIDVRVTASEVTDVNFAELMPSSVAGNVYIDLSNDGVFDPDEIGIGRTKVTLTGTNDVGRKVSMTGYSQEDGSYHFGNLRPGTYTVTIVAPRGMLPGIVNETGSLGGIASSTRITGILLNSGDDATDYNFGWIKTASLSGLVFHDKNKDGIRDRGEAGIANVTITLTGIDDLGRRVRIVTKTNASGTYAFNNLRPGVYTITEGRIANAVSGENTVGSLGGDLGNDAFENIFVGVGDFGRDYNFAEFFVKRGGKQDLIR
jgi:uncharacterized protein (DUF2141 family)